MTKKPCARSLGSLLVFLFLFWGGLPARAETILVMGTGLPGGNYHRLGQLFTQAVNKYAGQTGIRIDPRSTQGSNSNLQGLKKGTFQLGITQADAEYLAWNGQGHWKKMGAFKNLRTIYELYTEAVTCVSNAASKINTCADLRGKRVALGSKDSGTYINALQALDLCWLKPADLAQALTINPPQAMDLMRKGKLDAFFYTVGHPNHSLRQFIAQYGRARLLSFTPTQAMTKQVPYYVKYFVWTNDYPGLRNPGMKVDTFGIKSFLVTTDQVPPKVIYEITRIYLSHLKFFQKNLAPMREVEPPGRRSLGDAKWAVSCPYHQGVKRLLKERGAM